MEYLALLGFLAPIYFWRNGWFVMSKWFQVDYIAFGFGVAIASLFSIVGLALGIWGVIQIIN